MLVCCCWSIICWFASRSPKQRRKTIQDVFDAEKSKSVIEKLWKKSRRRRQESKKSRSFSTQQQTRANERSRHWKHDTLCGSAGRAEEEPEGRGGWRWCSRQDVAADLVHHAQLPDRVRPDRFVDSFPSSSLPVAAHNTAHCCGQERQLPTHVSWVIARRDSV